MILSAAFLMSIQRATLADISKCLMKVARSRHDSCY